MAGSSSRTLESKLGLKAGMAAAFVALPASLGSLGAASGLPQICRAAGAAELADAAGAFDFVIAFGLRDDALAGDFALLQAAIKRDGALWYRWPKKSSGVATSLGDVQVRSAALNGAATEEVRRESNSLPSASVNSRRHFVDKNKS